MPCGQRIGIHSAVHFISVRLTKVTSALAYNFAQGNTK